jgi:hypothetical protein
MQKNTTEYDLFNALVNEINLLVEKKDPRGSVLLDWLQKHKIPEMSSSLIKSFSIAQLQTIFAID